jgi:hypothetical protein
MQLYDTIKTTAKINGMDKNVIITIKFDHESDPDLDGMSPQEQEQTLSKIERGQLDCMFVMVTAHWAELSYFEGSDCLGQVFSASRADFDSTLKDHNMVQNAILELFNQTMQGIAETQTFLKAV